MSKNEAGSLNDLGELPKKGISRNPLVNPTYDKKKKKKKKVAEEIIDLLEKFDDAIVVWFNVNKGFGEVELADGRTALITKDEVRSKLKPDDKIKVEVRKSKEDIGTLKKGDMFVYKVK